MTRVSKSGGFYENPMQALFAAALLLALNGCAGVPMALSAAAGALTVAKDVFDLDVSIRQLGAVKAAAPIAGRPVPFVPLTMAPVPNP